MIREKKNDLIATIGDDQEVENFSEDSDAEIEVRVKARNWQNLV